MCWIQSGLLKASDAPTKASMHPNGNRARVEDEEPRVSNARLLDTINSLYYECSI